MKLAKINEALAELDKQLDTYHVKVTLRCGAVLTGAPRAATPDLWRIDTTNAEGDTMPAYIDPDHVAIIEGIAV